MKRQLRDEELAEDDGMAELRNHIHNVNQTCRSHEERGAALRELMITGPNKAAPIGTSASSSSATRAKLPELVFVAPKLEALPVELIENIACYLVLGDFGRLRLTCSALRHKSSHTFIKTYFTKRTLKLNWVSMRRLALIQAEPHLNAAIKDLLILVDEEGEFCKPSHYPRLPIYNRRSQSDSNDNSTEYLLSYNTNQARQNEMMLDRIFGRLPLLRSLLLSEQQPTSEWRKSSRVGMSIFALSLVFGAVASNGTKILYLAVGGQHRNSAHGFVYPSMKNAFGFLPLNAVLKRESAGFVRAFEHLKCLDISWAPASGDDVQHTSPIDKSSASGEFPNSLLKLTPNIERLVLRYPSSWPRFLEQMDQQVGYLDHCIIPLPKLKTLDLFIPRFLSSGKPLLALRMFKARCARLEKVGLNGLVSMKPTHVNGIVQKMKDEVGIRSVSFEMLDSSDAMEGGSEEDEI